VNTIPRDVAQTLIAKLDQKHIRPGEAKAFAQKHYSVTLPGRSREQVANAICAHLRTQERTQ